jgi:hypothetical protein
MDERTKAIDSAVRNFASTWQTATAAYDAGVAAERERLRDCRLCANFTVQSGGCVSVLRCVGGDRYRATTPRQYWEARPIEPAPF